MQAVNVGARFHFRLNNMSKYGVMNEAYYCVNWTIQVRAFVQLAFSDCQSDEYTLDPFRN